MSQYKGKIHLNRRLIAISSKKWILCQIIGYINIVSKHRTSLIYVTSQLLHNQKIGGKLNMCTILQTLTLLYPASRGSISSLASLFDVVFLSVGFT